MDTIENIITILKKPISEINMDLVDLYTSRYLAGDRSRPQHNAIAEAALALQEACAKMEYETATPKETISAADVTSWENARQALEIAHIKGNIAWGVPRANLPHDAQVEDVITIHYWDYSQRSVVVAEVVERIHYPEGNGLVLKLLETLNSFGISEPGGWRYIGFWMPFYKTAQAGFVKHF